MIIGLFARPVVCGWCGYPVINAVGLDPGCPGGPLSAPDPCGLLAPFLSCLALCLVIQACLVSWVFLSLPVLGWPCRGAGSSAVDVMCFEGHHFLIIYYTVIHGDLDPYCSVRHPCALHLYAFVLYIAPFLLCYFGRIIFLEYESGLWSIGHFHIWGSATVSGLF